jgi:nucleoid-associated protein YgaU
MGLFSFVKNAGAKLFGGKKKEAEKKVEEKIDSDNSANAAMATALKAVVSSLGLKVESLNIRVDGDAVTVSGIAASNEVREKVILAIGNVEGIASVDDQMDVMPSDEGTPRGVEDTRFYTVEKGDTLWKIAQDHYGNGGKHPLIFEANKPMLDSPDKIYPGQVLRIPALQA